MEIARRVVAVDPAMRSPVRAVSKAKKQSLI
jgi:hypothetical protein